MKLFNRTDGSERVTNKMLLEAKEQEFQFRFHEEDEERMIAASEVEIEKDHLKYHFDNSHYSLRFSKFTVQVLPASKVVNIISNPSPWIVLAFIALPLLVGFLLLEFSTNISEYTHINKDMVRGFALAVIIVGYLSQIGGSIYFKNLRKRRALRAVSSTSQVLTKLEKAADVEEYFSRLIQVNLSNMEQYYLLVRNQTEKSYKLTQFASIVGLVILSCGIILSFYKDINSPATMLTVSSGILVEFISAIFSIFITKQYRS